MATDVQHLAMIVSPDEDIRRLILYILAHGPIPTPKGRLAWDEKVGEWEA